MTARFLIGDVFERLAELEDGSVDMVVTSPPFLALRSYLPADHPDKALEIGSEATPAAFLDVMLAVTAELRRVLAPHGSIAIELGDTYAGSGGAGGDYNENGLRQGQPRFRQGYIPRNADGTPTRSVGYAQSYGPDEIWATQGKGGEGWPLAKSKTLIPELYRIGLAYGHNPLTGAESPAGRWRVRNVVTWARPNPPVGALGDKWRPATSDIVVACTSPKRYWDDLATRRAFKTESHPMGTGTVNGIPGTAVDRGYGPHGAPLLDYWEIPPGGYSGSHYAVYPPALVEPLVKAMCPERVCETCGEPSRRIVETRRVDPDGNAVTGDWNVNNYVPGEGYVGIQGAHDNRAGTAVGTQRTDIGWSDCGHGSIVCKSCNGLVPYDYAIRRPREASQVQGGMGQEEVLGEPVEVPNGQAEIPEGMRGLRSGVSGQDGASPSVQPLLFGEAGPHGGADELVRSRPGESSVEGRTKEPRGLRSDMGAPGVSGATEERLHDGASSSDAGTSRASAGTDGMGAPPERDQGRQPDREPGDSESRQARRDGDVPELRDGVPDPLGGYVCPCGSSDFNYVADHWRSGVVLDPFAGSGTTLAVATGHGRNAIGIDLDERNADLALERVGGLLLQVEHPNPTPSQVP